MLINVLVIKFKNLCTKRYNFIDFSHHFLNSSKGQKKFVKLQIAQHLKVYAHTFNSLPNVTPFSNNGGKVDKLV